MLLGAAELNMYLQSGFDHFTSYLDVPFNFMQVSLLRNPIPSDFGGHIVQLCASLSDCFLIRNMERVRWAFDQLSVMVASCVMLDYVRFRKGRLHDLFATYERFFDHAMAEYLELHCLCSYTDQYGARTCTLVKARHVAKDHQDERGIIAAGEHVAAFDWRFAEYWKGQVRTAIEGLHWDLAYELEQVANGTETVRASEERIALDLHLENLNRFFHSVGPATGKVSHSKCFSCLMEVPEHPLPCGHVLCDQCVEAYGRPRKRSVSMTCCPLHRDSSQWIRPAVIRRKPDGAGVRILSLDSGGIRGIVQLEVLRAIQLALGGHMPVQWLFDLMVGAGTGGLIAVALGSEGKTVQHCLDLFGPICEHAYIPRLALASKSNPTPKSKGSALLSQIAKVFKVGPRHKSGLLYTALRTTFTTDSNFFGSLGRLSPGSRVAVTSLSATEGKPLVLTNYRGPDHTKARHSVERAHGPSTEPKTWQCVAATMADPTYFPPLVANNKVYQNRGRRCINPAFLADEEARRSWPDIKEPDVCLSLGSGQHRSSVVEKLQDSASAVNAASLKSSSQDHGDGARKMKNQWLRRHDVLEAELDWQSFKATAIDERLHSRGLIRFNPDLGKEVPDQDRKDLLKPVQELVRTKLREPHWCVAVDNMAQRLIATSFYLDIRSETVDEKGAQVIFGAIMCRWEDGSAEVRALGRVLEDRRKDDFVPFFQLRPASQSNKVYSRLTITGEKTTRMVKEAVFEQSNVILRVDGNQQAFSIHLFLVANNGLEPERFPISGFPRGILRRPRDRGSRVRPCVSGWNHLRRGSDRTSSIVSESLLSRHPAIIRHPAVSNSSADGSSCSTSNTNSHIRSSASVEDPPIDIEAQYRRASSEINHILARLRDEVNEASGYKRISRIDREASGTGCGDPRPAETSLIRPHSPRFDGSRSMLHTTMTDDESGWAETMSPTLSVDPDGEEWHGSPSCDTVDSRCEDIFDKDDPFYRSLVEEQSI